MHCTKRKVIKEERKKTNNNAQDKTPATLLNYLMSGDIA